MWSSFMRAEQTFSFQAFVTIRGQGRSTLATAKQKLQMLLPYSSRIFFRVSFYSQESVQYFTTNELAILAWMLLQNLLANGGSSVLSFRTELWRLAGFREMGSTTPWPWHSQEIGPPPDCIPRVHCWTLHPWCAEQAA